MTESIARESGQARSPLVLYHGGCPDGFAAALAAWKVLGSGAHYQEVLSFGSLPADVDGRSVYVLDFAFDRPAMEELGRRAAEVTVLDHHASSKDRLNGYRPVCCGKVHIDLGHSGAVLAWQHFHPDKPLPFLYECIQSRDLWRWNVEGDREFLAWLDAQPRTFEVWDAVSQARPENLREELSHGAVLMAQFESLCRQVAKGASPLVLFGHEGLVVNASHVFASAVGELLYERSGTFGLVWSITPDGAVRCSLRSKAPFDARAIAERFGGGGHPQAAGFVLPRSHLNALLQGRIE